MTLARPKRGRPIKDHRRFFNIAVSLDYRGINDDQLYFLFRDPPRDILKKVFTILIANGIGIAEKAVITEEHDIVRRAGKGYWRKAVELVNPNYKLCNLDGMKLLIETQLQKIHPCKVQWMSIDKFLNI